MGTTKRTKFIGFTMMHYSKECSANGKKLTFVHPKRACAEK